MLRSYSYSIISNPRRSQEISTRYPVHRTACLSQNKWSIGHFPHQNSSIQTSRREALPHRPFSENCLIRYVAIQLVPYYTNRVKSHLLALPELFLAPAALNLRNKDAWDSQFVLHRVGCRYPTECKGRFGEMNRLHWLRNVSVRITNGRACGPLEHFVQ